MKLGQLSRTAGKGRNQASSSTSGKLGTLVMTCEIICTTGTFLLGDDLWNYLWGWPTLWVENTELFPEMMQYCINLSHRTKENSSLLTSGNLEDHISIKVVEMAHAAEVTIVTLLPHCSYKRHPLDKTVFPPFKMAYIAFDKHSYHKILNLDLL